MTALLRTDDLCVTFGGLRAVDGLDLEVASGQLVGLIGPNGAGKTTAIDAISGFVRSTGSVVFDGERISGLRPHQRARRGLARTWQSLELFDDLTIAENLMVAAETSSLGSVLRDLMLPHRGRSAPGVFAGLDLLDIAHVADRMPSEVSQGTRKLVGVARALAASPKLVCLDEPAAGLDTNESARLGERLRSIVDTGIAMLLVDHDMNLVMNVCDYVYVIEFGHQIAKGAPTEVIRDPLVLDAYLGRVETEGNGVTAILEIEGLATGYDGVSVVRDLTLEVGAGEVVALLGPNGAGKTTTLLAVSGLRPILAGDIKLFGRSIKGRAAHRIARDGLAHVPEGRSLFMQLTVGENLRLGVARGSANIDYALGYFPALAPLLARRSGLLSGGEQQMLAMARALTVAPRLLIVDEMSLGLAPIIVARLLPVLRTIASDTGAGVLVVEQHVEAVLDVADRAYVLSHGDLVLAGSTQELREDRTRLESSYLGTVHGRDREHPRRAEHREHLEHPEAE